MGGDGVVRVCAGAFAAHNVAPALPRTIAEDRARLGHLRLHGSMIGVLEASELLLPGREKEGHQAGGLQG